MRSAFPMRLRVNALILWGVALEAALLLAINWAPPVNAALATLAIPTRLSAAGAACARDALLDEGSKWLARRRTAARA